MRINYEIRSQLGFSNTGRLSGKKKGKVNTPCLMLPIMKHFSYLKKESSICKFLENRKHWIGNRVLDPVNIAEPIRSKVNNSTAKEHSSNETSELRTNIEKNIWCLQSREMQGIPLK